MLIIRNILCLKTLSNEIYMTDVGVFQNITSYSAARKKSCKNAVRYEAWERRRDIQPSPLTMWKPLLVAVSFKGYKNYMATSLGNSAVTCSPISSKPIPPIISKL